jgi:hypothetical protein
MKFLALATALVMSAATAASADPPRTYDRDHDADHVTFTRDHYARYNQSHWARDFHGRWAPFSQIAAIRGEKQFSPSINNNRYRKIRVEAVRGQPMISKVTIEFNNGAIQAVDMNTSLQAGSGEVIDLNGDVRQIHRVIVYSDPQTRGSYTVYGA